MSDRDTVRVRVLPVHGEPYDYQIEARSMLAELQRLVGGYIEIVSGTEGLHQLGTWKNRGRVVMVVNEEGRIDGLPRNAHAEPYYPILGIHGPAVLIGEVDVWGDDPGRDFVSLPDGVLS